MVIVEIPSNIALTLAVIAGFALSVFVAAFRHADAVHRVVVALLWGSDDDDDESGDDEDGGAAPTDNPYSPPRAKL